MHVNLELIHKLIKFNIIKLDVTSGDYYIDEDIELKNLRKSLGFEDVSIKRRIYAGPVLM